jgi:hypothetical protein
MRQRYGEIVIGVDFDTEIVEKHRRAGRNVIAGDVSDIDFWERAFADDRGKMRMVILAMPQHTANMNALNELRQRQFRGKIAATAMFDDEVKELKQAGAHAAYNIYAEAGFGYAEHICQAMEDADPSILDL